jgi:hypothetical protein
MNVDPDLGKTIEIFKENIHIRTIVVCNTIALFLVSFYA